MVLAVTQNFSEKTTLKQADVGLISSLSTNPQMCMLAQHFHYTQIQTRPYLLR